MRVQTIQPPDSHYLSAALGWLGLGSVADARAELSRISPENWDHPATLETRWLLHVEEKDWARALVVAQTEMDQNPDESSGWLHRAYAMRRVGHGGLTQAWDALLPAADLFPDEAVIAFNLACYACQMQRLDLAWEWLHRALAAGTKKEIKKMALADEDLKPLWPEIKVL